MINDIKSIVPIARKFSKTVVKVHNQYGPDETYALNLDSKEMMDYVVTVLEVDEQTDTLFVGCTRPYVLR